MDDVSIKPKWMMSDAVALSFLAFVFTFLVGFSLSGGSALWGLATSYFISVCALILLVIWGSSAPEMDDDGYEVPREIL